MSTKATSRPRGEERPEIFDLWDDAEPGDEVRVATITGTYTVIRTSTSYLDDGYVVGVAVHTKDDPDFRTELYSPGFTRVSRRMQLGCSLTIFPARTSAPDITGAITAVHQKGRTTERSIV